MSPIAHLTAEDATAELYALLTAVKRRAAVRAHLALIRVPDRADAATEMMQAVFEAPMPLPEFAVGFDFAELTHLREKSRLSDEEWDEAVKATDRTERGSKAEDTHGSDRPLAAKQQFRLQEVDKRPLSIIRCDMVDYRIMYEAGVKAGNGSEEERAVVRQFVETWELFDDELRVVQLQLLGKSRYRVALEYSQLGNWRLLLMRLSECLKKWTCKGSGWELFQNCTRKGVLIFSGT